MAKTRLFNHKTLADVLEPYYVLSQHALMCIQNNMNDLRDERLRKFLRLRVIEKEHSSSEKLIGLQWCSNINF